MAVINTNTASLNSQRILNSSQAGLNTSIQRLSSGLRINSAKDDAAGMAISQRMTSQVNGMNQAMRNANDGISLAQTAESAMGSTGDAFQRIRELALQSANASNTKEDRESIQKEVTQLTSEIDRIADQTSFNGNKLLNGDFKSAAFQIGAEAGQTITVNSITDTRTKSIGSTLFAKGSEITVKATEGFTGAKINGVDIADVAAVATGGDATVQATAISKAINDKADLTGVYAKLDGAKITLSSIKADENITITNSATTPLTTNVAFENVTAAEEKKASDIDVSTIEGAQQAIGIATNALNKINSGRADLGAIQNRFSSVVSNLQVNSENLSAARSRIMDTDFASETANMTRNQILQQAGTAMLAQANQLPNSVMSLLRG